MLPDPLTKAKKLLTPPVRYDIQILLNPAPIAQAPGPGCGAMAYALNNNGDIAGSVRTPYENTVTDVGAIWSLTATIPTYSMPSETNGSKLVDINDEGDAIGYLGAGRPVVVHHGQWSDLTAEFGLPNVEPDPSTNLIPRVTGINNAGWICGFPPSLDRIPVGWIGHLYNWTTKTPRPIPVLPGYINALPVAINQASDTTGWTWSVSAEDVPYSDVRHVFVTSGSGVTDLGPGWPGDINDSHQACGNLGDLFSAPGIWDLSQTPPTFSQIPLPPGCTYGSANGINNYGDVVGSCWPSADDYGTPFVYLHDFNASWDLRELIPNGNSWSQMEAFDINDAGDIVGRGFHNGCYVAFRLQQHIVSRPPSNLDLIPELVLRIFGGVTYDGQGWGVTPSGHRVPIDPGPGPIMDSSAGARWAELSPEKRDILLGLALDELASHIEDSGARDALRQTSLDLVRSQTDQLLQSLQRQGDQAQAQLRGAAGAASLRRVSKLELLIPDLKQRLQQR